MVVRQSDFVCHMHNKGVGGGVCRGRGGGGGGGCLTAVTPMGTFALSSADYKCIVLPKKEAGDFKVFFRR